MSEFVSFGETMLRFSPPGNERLEDAEAFEVHVGGAESNVAIATQRMGTPAAWISKLPETPLGRKVDGKLRQYGVETDVSWSPRGRVGTYYLEQAGEPRGTNVVYDRRDAAITSAEVRHLNVDLVRNARVFFTTGITPALSPTLRETTMNLLKAAKEGGTTTAFDFNYRAKLWSPDAAKETLTQLFPGIDVLVIAARDAQRVLGYDGEPQQLAHKLGSQYNFETVIVTRGSEGAVGWHDSVVHEQDAYETDTVSQIGTGDAFTGTFIARRLDGDDVPTAMEYAAAAAALKRTIPGDVALITAEEVEAVVRQGATALSR